MNTKQLLIKTRWEAGLAYRRYKLKGLFNYILSIIDLILRLPFVLAKPITLHIPVIEGICNLSCKTCYPFRSGYRRELSFETFKTIFDKFDYAFRLILGAWGEPFLVKDIFKMIDYAKSGNCYVGLVTNMTLVDENMAKKIVESKLDYLGISIDAADPELFERIRTGADFEAIINNIKTLNRIKKEFDSKKPKLFFEFVGLKDNIHEIPKIIELAYRLGITMVKVNSLRVFGTGLATEEQSLTNYPKLAESLFLAAQKKAEKLGITFSYPECKHRKKRFFDICPLQWTDIDILIDGTVIPCCAYVTSLGNVFKDNVNRIWNNKIFSLTRRAVKKERAVCYYCMSGLNKLGLKKYSPH